MDCCSDSCNNNDLLNLEDAEALMANAIAPVQSVETCSIENSLDRILADDIFAKNDIPNYDNSAMDGYAFNLGQSNPETPLKIIGQSLAGNHYVNAVGPGECILITTGAQVPDSCNCVVMKENTTQSDDQHIQITYPVTTGDNIRKTGNDVAKDSIVLRAGRRVSPIDIGMLASVGVSEVPVYKRIRVGLLSTGDELTPLGQPLEKGFIHDSNRYLIRATLERLNFEVIDFGVIPDNPSAIERTFKDASKACDAIVSSGGVSVGDADFTKDILNSLGDVEFHKLAIKPGKPFAFGSMNKAFFFGLPGNPVSAAVTFNILALPALCQLSGEKATGSVVIQAKCTSDLRKKPGRMDFQRGYLYQEGEHSSCVRSTGQQSSGALSSMVKANCYIKLEKDRGNVCSGETVTVIPFNRYFV